MLQKFRNVTEYWKLDENLIVNDFGKPYIAIAFGSWHLLMNTASDSLLWSVSILSHLVLSLVGGHSVFTFSLASF